MPHEDLITRCSPGPSLWSNPVGELRARLVTSHSNAVADGLRLVLQLENTSSRPLELHWSGYRLGLATFRLDDATGIEIPEPDWRYGGNEHGGNWRLVVPGSATTEVVVADDLFAKFGDRRTIRIGAFWGRELPVDNQERFLRAHVTGGDPAPDEVAAVEGTKTQHGTAWTGTLEVPAVCLR